MRKKKLISNKISYIRPIDRVILIVVFLAFVLLIVAMGIGTKRYKHNQILLVQDSMDILADNQEIQFEQYIRDKVSLLQGLTKFPEIYEMDRQKQKDFIKGKSKALGFHHLFIAAADGAVFYVEEDLTRDQKNEIFFHDIMNNNIYITEPFYGGDATTMTISVSILKGGQKVGALCGAIELKEIQEMFRKNRMFLNGSSYLINRKGYYMASEDMDKVYNKVTIYEESGVETALIEQAFAERKDQSGTMLYDDAECQVNITYLKNFDWAILQCVKTEEIFKDLDYIDVWQYTSLAIVAIIVICVIRIAVYWNRSARKINTDTLTGCGSRLAMQNLIERLNSSKKFDVAVIYLDLNKFKQINDTCGHETGDQILCIFSEVLVSVFGNDGYVGRIGGDEFMVVMLNTDEAEIVTLCEKVNTQLIDKVKELELPHMISTSYGYAIREKGSNANLKTIVDKADERMYDYKEKHR